MNVALIGDIAHWLLIGALFGWAIFERLKKNEAREECRRWEFDPTYKRWREP